MKLQESLSLIFITISFTAFILFLMLRSLDISIAYKNHKDTNSVFKSLFYDIVFMSAILLISFSLHVLAVK